MYAAITYVRIGDALFTPGEIIDREIRPETAQMLLGKGAIREESVRAEEPKAQSAGRKEKPARVEREELDVDEDVDDEQAAQEELMGDLVRGRRGKK